MTKPFHKSKTFWTAVSGIVGAVGAWQTGAVDAATAAQTVFGGLLAVFLRDGMNKKETG